MHFIFLPLISCLVLLSASNAKIQSSNRSFVVDYENETFLKDGHPFRYIAGTLHYFQIPRELWRDRMLRVRALGCNALQTYVMWSRHQPTENQFEFIGDANFTDYLSLANELGFVVILRAGPYIDAEQDFGGLPYWLLKNKGIILRSSKDDRYLKAVENWLSYLLPTVIKPMLYQNNGPVIMVQIENEYGLDSHCDHNYTNWLKELAQKHLGNQTVLFTTDPPVQEVLQCGYVPGVLPTTDFGVRSKDGVLQGFSILRKFLPKGPMVNSEFYPGWFDDWGSKIHTTTPMAGVVNTMRYIWDLNITSFTIYPAHGGSNWGYEAGGNAGSFSGVTTGYDFDAPISESGDTTPKFLGMRSLIEELTGRKIQDPIPESPPKYAYGKFRMEWMGTVLDTVQALVAPDRIFKSEYPLTMEEIDQAYGFVLYETTISDVNGTLVVKGVHDRAYVIVDGQLTSVIQRTDDGSNGTVIQLSKFQNLDSKAANGSKVHILVENQGRIAYGPINDPKGLLSNVTLNDQVLTNWTMYPIDLSRIYNMDSDNLQQFMQYRKGKSPKDRANKYLPSIYYGYFFANPKIGDTFYDPSGWGKGQLFINGRNIGRYWPQAGPQITLYVPGVFLTQGDPFNQIYVFELDQPGFCEPEEPYGCWAEFTDKPKYNQ